MLNWLERTKPFFGEEGLEKLKNSTVAIFGLGGVGSFAAEAIVRSGVGNLIFVDFDSFSITNLNRQLYATTKTIGKFKTTIAKQRALSINPDVKIKEHRIFLNEKTANLIDFSSVDSIIDAVDFVPAKIKLAQIADEFKIKIISCMGTQNRLNPSLLTVTDVFKTSNCPLAKKIRINLKKMNIKALPVVCSTEKPFKFKNDGLHISASNSFVPASAGLLLASHTVKTIVES